MIAGRFQKTKPISVSGVFAGNFPTIKFFYPQSEANRSFRLLHRGTRRHHRVQLPSPLGRISRLAVERGAARPTEGRFSKRPPCCGARRRLEITPEADKPPIRRNAASPPIGKCAQPAVACVLFVALVRFVVHGFVWRELCRARRVRLTSAVFPSSGSF